MLAELPTWPELRAYMEQVQVTAAAAGSSGQQVTAAASGFSGPGQGTARFRWQPACCLHGLALSLDLPQRNAKCLQCSNALTGGRCAGAIAGVRFLGGGGGGV
jgi:hypothetical protein